ncbi:MAG TPA: hypothetical protein VLC55_04350 [Burkholderiales bacterium]|nr:hypothetical protein [Burkholderiales bacterium]
MPELKRAAESAALDTAQLDSQLQLAGAALRDRALASVAGAGFAGAKTYFFLAVFFFAAGFFAVFLAAGFFAVFFLAVAIMYSFSKFATGCVSYSFRCTPDAPVSGLSIRLGLFAETFIAANGCRSVGPFYAHQKKYTTYFLRIFKVPRMRCARMRHPREEAMPSTARRVSGNAPLE